MNLETIKTELREHIISTIEEMQDENILELGDLFHRAFNQDYYIIGYYQCEQWLKKHNISIFEAIQFCQDYEYEQFGEYYKRYNNAEELVNMMTYIIGEELVYKLN